MNKEFNVKYEAELQAVLDKDLNSQLGRHRQILVEVPACHWV